MTDFKSFINGAHESCVRSTPRARARLQADTRPACLLVFFATVHTLPFIIQPLMDWNHLRSTAYAGSFMSYFYNWTGVGAYVPLVWLVFSSFEPIRNWSYEFWVVQHIASAVLFLGFMFHHTQAWLYSWNYLYATTAVWFASCVARVVFTWTSTGIKPVKAEAYVLAGDIVKLDIPTRSRWLPGAHVFVRLPTVNITVSPSCAPCGRFYADTVYSMTAMSPFHGG